MEKITFYRAVDGTEWEDEDDCLNYELKLQAGSLIGEFAMYDYDKRPLEFSADLDPDRVVYITINSEKAGLFINEWFESHGCGYIPFDEKNPLCGLWRWVDAGHFGYWSRWETEMEQMAELGRYFQRFWQEVEPD